MSPKRRMPDCTKILTLGKNQNGAWMTGWRCILHAGHDGDCLPVLMKSTKSANANAEAAE